MTVALYLKVKKRWTFFGRLNVSPTPIIHQANRELQPTIADYPQAALQQVTDPFFDWKNIGSHKMDIFD